MAFMQPTAEHFAAYHVETDAGTEIVPESVCGDLEKLFTEFSGLKGSMIRDVERKEGWYGRLSAPGYLDATDWDGPHATAEEAIEAVKETFDVDDNGEDASEASEG